MKERFHEIVKRKPVVLGVEIDFSPLLWSIVQATVDRSPEEIAMVVLGQLSPATPFDVVVEGAPYPDGFGADELFRAEKPVELAVATKKNSSTSLGELLEGRIGTPETYSIVLAVALTVHGYPCKLAITGPDAVPSRYPFVLRSSKTIDLFGMATAAPTRELRAHKSVSV